LKRHPLLDCRRISSAVPWCDEIRRVACDQVQPSEIRTVGAWPRQVIVVDELERMLKRLGGGSLLSIGHRDGVRAHSLG
jgi:hypothetical protein